MRVSGFLIRGVICCGLLAAVAGGASAQEEAPAGDEVRPSRDWSEAIDAFEAADRESPPQPRGVLFVGSSSIRLWDLDRWFPDLDAANRGFGGSQYCDLVYYFDRLVTPRRPATIVVYSGDNDAAAGKPPAEIARDVRRFVDLVRRESPSTRIAFIPAKPSVARWEIYDRIAEGNRRIEEMCSGDERLAYVDVAAAMLSGDGPPPAELFVDDGLHLSDAGYEMWTTLVQEVLDAWAE